METSMIHYAEDYHQQMQFADTTCGLLLKKDFSEDDVFDLSEFLITDNVSKPMDGYLHSYGGCGMHY